MGKKLNYVRNRDAISPSLRGLDVDRNVCDSQRLYCTRPVTKGTAIKPVTFIKASVE